MQAVLVILAVVLTKVMAWEQIYGTMTGINDERYTDSDGINYRAGDKPILSNNSPLDIGAVPESDRHLYQQYLSSSTIGSPITFEVPLTDDGVYVLIAKFAHGNVEQEKDILNMTINTDIQLLTNVDMDELVGGHLKSIAKYFYFCVTNKTIHYKQQASQLLDGKVSIDVWPVEGTAAISSVVVLKGVLGERQTLKSSNTNETLEFDSLNFACPQASETKTQPPFMGTQHESFLELWTNIQASFEGVCRTSDFQKEITQSIDDSKQIKAEMAEQTAKLKKIFETLQADILKKIEAIQVEQASMRVQLNETLKKASEVRTYLLGRW